MKDTDTTADPLPTLPALLGEILAILNAATEVGAMRPFVKSELLTALDRFCVAAHQKLQIADVMVDDLREGNRRLLAMLDAARPEHN
jgi:hypothetical protein